MAIVDSTTYEAPGQSGSPVELQERYENFIGGEWIAPTTGEYRENLTPSTGDVGLDSDRELDVLRARMRDFAERSVLVALRYREHLNAAHAAKDDWGNGTALQKKRANFALNARKWK